MFTRVRSTVTAVALAVVLGAAATARAEDPVLEWNRIALAATTTAGQGPLPQIRSMAIVHAAIHDAVNAIGGTYDSYAPPPLAPPGASPEAAAIAAAHRVLAALFPLQSFGSFRASSLAANGVSDTDPGVLVGEAAADAILALRSQDGAAQAQFPYTAPGAGLPGVWVPIGAAPAATPGWGRVTPWVLRSGSQFRPEGPPALESERYARDLAEVKALGAGTNSSRTDEETQIARFWLGSPSAVWNSVARGVLEARNPGLAATARTLALMYIAAADASIACWDAKYTYNFWRPLTAIRNADIDGNPDTVADPLWTPFGTVPQHPEYPSGHSTNSGAMAFVLALLFGDDPGTPILAESPTTPTFPRSWNAFSEGVDEVIHARVYSGFHFHTSDEVGARVGRQVAQFVFTHALRARK